jgi:hypothetical protein
MASRKLLFYALLGAATLGLSQFLAAWRAWRAAPGVEAAAHVLVLGIGLLAAGLWLGFLLYEVDRAAGRVRRQIALYEWVLARRGAAGRGGPAPMSEGRASASSPSRNGGGPERRAG